MEWFLAAAQNVLEQRKSFVRIIKFGLEQVARHAPLDNARRTLEPRGAHQKSAAENRAENNRRCGMTVKVSEHSMFEQQAAGMMRRDAD